MLVKSKISNEIANTHVKYSTIKVLPYGRPDFAQSPILLLR